MQELRIEKKKKQGRRLSPFWIGLVSFLFLSVSVFYVSTCSAVQSIIQDLYEELGTDISMEKWDQTVAQWTGEKIMNLLEEQGWEAAIDYCHKNKILFSVYTPEGRRMGGNLPLDREAQAMEIFYTMGDTSVPDKVLSGHTAGNSQLRKLKLLLPENWTHHVIIVFPEELETPLKGGVVFGILGAVSFVALVWSLRNMKLGFLGILRGLPLEGYLAILWGGAWYARKGINSYLEGLELLYDFSQLYLLNYLMLIYAAVITLALTAGCILRPGGYRHTLCFRLLRAAWEGLRREGAMWREALRNLPMAWKTAVAATVLSLLELGAVLILVPDGACRWVLLGLWLAEKLMVFPLVICIGISFRKFRRMAKELAAGNLGYKLEQGYLPRMFRGFREDMNAVADSVNIAVEEKLKSQHFKTELISNVSHDIKTPLTSIINFSDLICKEETENANITEYAAHLHQQSVRLKKLLEDLIEASKASTGNLEVHMETCEMKVLLGQCLGEFETLLGEKGMELVVRMEGEPVYVLADPRMLWRVFENLMANVRKYALENTRVFLNLEQEKDMAVVTIKNISRYPLETTPEELMERFTRGDKSRHTEGNGLGLSIVKSLMELMGGDLGLEIDGDLFKAKVYFRLTQQEQGK